MSGERAFVAIILTLVVACMPIITCNNVFAEEGQAKEEKKIFFSLGLKSRIYNWKIEQKQYGTLGRIFDSGKTIEEIDSSSGISLGPEAELFIHWLYIRGFYLQGDYSFDTGDATRKDTGIDVGFGGMGEKGKAAIFLGWRRMEASFSNWQSANIKDHDVSDGVWGVLLGTGDSPGFVGHLEMAFGLKATGDTLSENEDDDFDDYEKNPFIGEGEIDIGYRFEAIPLAISAGYGIWWYHAEGNKTSNNIERPENTAHGPTIKISYSF